MRAILFLALFLASALARAHSSTIEFSLVRHGYVRGIDKYRLTLDETNPLQDVLSRQDGQGRWEDVYEGPIDFIELPLKALVEKMERKGPRAGNPGLLRHGDYDLNGDTAAGLRLRSGAKLVVITDFGGVALPWPGEVFDVRLLDSEVDSQSGNSVEVISVKGRVFGATYVVLNFDSDNPYPVLNQFIDKPMRVQFRDKIIEFPNHDLVLDPAAIKETQRVIKLMAQPTLDPQAAKQTAKVESQPRPGQILLPDLRPKHYNAYKRNPTPEEVIDELILALDTRDLADAPNAVALAGPAISELILREFPALRPLLAEDQKMRKVFARVVEATARMWSRGRIPDGAFIRRFAETRLEVLVPDRAKCELALLSIRGANSHADSYDRGVILRGLNTLYRSLYSAKRRRSAG